MEIMRPPSNLGRPRGSVLSVLGTVRVADGNCSEAWHVLKRHPTLSLCESGETEGREKGTPFFHEPRLYGQAVCEQQPGPSVQSRLLCANPCCPLGPAGYSQLLPLGHKNTPNREYQPRE